VVILRSRISNKFRVFDNLNSMIAIAEISHKKNNQLDYKLIYGNKLFNNDIFLSTSILINKQFNKASEIEELLYNYCTNVINKDINCEKNVYINGKYYSVALSMIENNYVCLNFVDNTDNIMKNKTLEVYKKVFNKAKDIIIIMDKDGKILNVNEEAVKEYGYTYEEFLSLYIFNLKSSRNMGEGYKQFTPLDSQPLEFDAVHYRKDGTFFYAEVKSVVINLDNNKYLVSIVRNITSRRKDEEERRFLASIVNSSEDAIVGQDVKGFITSWNRGAEKLFGYSKNEIIGKNFSTIIPNNINNIEHILNSASERKKVEKYETVSLKKNGESVNVSITISPILDEDNNLVGFSSITRDITEEKLKEQEIIERYEELSSVYEELTAAEEELKTNYIELKNAKDEAERANKAKSQFLANMSHEIRTPMNGILGMLELLKLTELNSEQIEYVDMIKASTDNLLEIINDILDISKIESGKLELYNTEFSFKENMDKIIKELILACRDKNLEVMYQIDPFINNKLIGDVVRLNQVITNLLNNAIKFTESGHIFFRVQKITQSSEKVRIQFSVEDTGIGISESFKDRIFMIFNQADISYTKRYGGTGLGLAISKQLVQMMNGQIWYDSKEGKGSTFYFTAEFSLATKENDFIFNEKTEDSFTNISDESKNKTVLIVEDNEINMKITSRFLNITGYNYSCCYNGKEALEYIKNNNVDLILMDIQMPVMNGYEASVAIREYEKEKGFRVPIIAMTAYAMSGDREKFLNCGMDDYISKPFNLRELNEMVQKYIF
jgi:PAS domain S-box-containing protein